MKRSKYENTVVTALRQGWTIEDIFDELPQIIDPMTIHNIAKRHGLKARHESREQQRSRQLAKEARQYGVASVAARQRSENLSNERRQTDVRSLAKWAAVWSMRRVAAAR